MFELLLLFRYEYVCRRANKAILRANRLVDERHHLKMMLLSRQQGSNVVPFRRR